MEEIFDRISQHFTTKNGYFDVFGRHLLAMEDWIRGEIVWLMHQSPLKEQGIFEATSKGREQRPDLQLKISDRVVSVELKAIVIEPDSPRWDFDPRNKLVSEFKRLASRDRDWFISVAYPLVGLDKWEQIVAEAADRTELRDYYVKNSAFDIGEGKQCLISLFGAFQYGSAGRGQ